MRRSTIVTANAKVDSYKKLVGQWKTGGRKGKRPHINLSQNVMPCFYRENMFRENGDGFAIKVYRNHDWVWLPVTLRKTDLDYIHKNCSDLKESAPVLYRVNHGYELRFSYALPKSEKNFIKDKDVKTVVGVDLGINSDAVCSAVTTDGTVTGQKFINNPVEKDRLYTTPGRIRKCQAHGNTHPRRQWRFADNYNEVITVKTAVGIVDYAKSVSADVIVFENLSDLRGQAHGRSRQKIAIWRKKEIWHRVEEMASRIGIRVSYVFANGKQYNCDLSASRNIAARFFIRRIRKSMPETAWLQARAKVPGLSTRTECTLATLISLSAAAM